MRRSLPIAVAVALVVALATTGAWWWLAEPPPPPPPPYDWSRVDQALERMVTDNELPGAAMIITTPDGRIYERTLGDFTMDTVVTVGSASKWASAAAILTLVEDGTLELDDRVSDWVDPFDTDTHRDITLGQLLSHRAGFWAKHPCLREYKMELQRCVEMIAQAPLLHEPGTAFGYGSLSYHAAAAMVEQATGQPWRDVFQTRLADPLQMTQTRFGRKGRSPNPGIAGNLNSSAGDFSRFLTMLMGGGELDGVRVLTAETVRDMEGPHAGPGLRFGHIPNRHGASKQDLYGYGVWRDVVSEQGEILVVSAPGKFGFTPWIDHRIGVAGVLAAEFTEEQLEDGKPPDPADVIFVVCDIVRDAREGPDHEPCRRRGIVGDDEE